MQQSLENEFPDEIIKQDSTSKKEDKYLTDRGEDLKHFFHKNVKTLMSFVVWGFIGLCCVMVINWILPDCILSLREQSAEKIEILVFGGFGAIIGGFASRYIKTTIGDK